VVLHLCQQPSLAQTPQSLASGRHPIIKTPKYAGEIARRQIPQTLFICDGITQFRVVVALRDQEK
jgi:hypothetical protein